MKKLFLFVVSNICLQLVKAQNNVGIGVTNPQHGKLVVNGKVGAVSALFGDSTTGVAIENDFPGIGLNSYFHGTRKSIANGFGGLIGMDPINGDFHIYSSPAAGTAGSTLPANLRLLINKDGNIGLQGNGAPIAPLSFSNAVGNKLSFYNAGPAFQYGIGLQANTMQLYTDQATSDIAFGHGSSNAFTENMRITGKGQLSIGTTTPDASAMLHLQSNSKGFLPPRMTSTQRNFISNPAAGLVVFDTEKQSLYLYDGMEWKPLLTGTASQLPGTPVTEFELQEYDFFGASVAISGNTAVVGASRNGQQIGAAYVYVNTGSAWVQQAKLVPADGVAIDYYGHSVAIAGDYIMVGAPKKNSSKGVVYAYSRSGTTWGFMGQLKASPEISGGWFGTSISMNGIHAFIGAKYYSPGGALFTFKRGISSWIAAQILHGPVAGGSFGADVEVWGNHAVAGAPEADKTSMQNAGAAVFYQYINNVWVAGDTMWGLHADDHFGTSVSINGVYAAIGAPNADGIGGSEGEVYMFKFNGNWWQQRTIISAAPKYRTANSKFGNYVSLYGDYLIVNAEVKDGNPGGAFFYKRDISYPANMEWRLKSKLTDENADLDNSNSIENLFINGSTVAITYPYALNNKGKVIFKNIE